MVYSEIGVLADRGHTNEGFSRRVLSFRFLSNAFFDQSNTIQPIPMTQLCTLLGRPSSSRLLSVCFNVQVTGPYPQNRSLRLVHGQANVDLGAGQRFHPLGLIVHPAPRKRWLRLRSRPNSGVTTSGNSVELMSKVGLQQSIMRSGQNTYPPFEQMGPVVQSLDLKKKVLLKLIELSSLQ